MSWSHAVVLRNSNEGWTIIRIVLKSFQNSNENHARILLKSIKNHWKSVENWVPEGSWAVWGPFRGARRPRDRFFIDFGVHFGSHFGAEIHKNRKKIDLEWFKELKRIGHALGWLPTSIFSWFWSHFGVFLRWFVWCFLNVVTTCTLTSFFKYFFNDFLTSSLQ